MKKSILLISLAVLPLFGYSQNVLPDWALGGFVRPEKANPIITNYAGVDGMTVTSAMKGLYPATYDTLTDVIVNGNWEKYVGKIETLGLVSGTDPEANYVQIPMGDGTQWSDSFTQDDYKAMVADMFDGKVTVSNDTKKAPTDFATAITVNDQGQIKG